MNSSFAMWFAAYRKHADKRPGEASRPKEAEIIAWHHLSRPATLAVFWWTGMTMLALAVGCVRVEPDRESRVHGREDVAGAVVPSPGQIISASLRTRRPNGAYLFQCLASTRTGIDFENRLDTTHPLRRLYYGYSACGGVAIGDVDGDARPDIYLVSGPAENRLYRQTAQFRFEDITHRAGVDGGLAWGAGATFVDVDNDGDLDLYVCNYDAPNAMYINRGDGTFTNRAQRMKVDVVDACVLGAFADYDLDGDLDLYILTNRYHRQGGRPERPPFEMRDGKPSILPEFQKYYGLRNVGANSFTLDNIGRPDRLLKNNGDGTFSDVTDRAGIHGEGHGLSVTWWDYNQDGLPDIYVGNDFDDPDRLYRNNGDGTFNDLIASAVPHTTWSSMGADVGDINNDGHLDLFSLDMSATTHAMQKRTMGTMDAERIARVAGPPPQVMRNALLVNTGTGRFLEAAYLANVANSDWSWAAKLLDLDNDGRLDLFITNGVPRSFNDSDIPFSTDMLVGRTVWDLYENTPPRPEQNLALANQGDFQFENVSRAWGLDHIGISFSAAHGDLDGDGDLDLVVMNVDEPVSVYRNQSVAGHRVLIRLYGSVSNRFGVGAKVSVTARGGRQVRELMPTTGFMSSNQPLIHFGLGEDHKLDTLTVDWPSGHRQTFTDLPADRFYAIAEPAGAPARRVRAARRRKWFTRSRKLRGIRHRETPFNDFARQPLLPNKHSQLGPGMAWGDVDGDGDEDVFVGGASGQPGLLYLNDSHGGFHQANVPAFHASAAAEDMASLWIDVDGDRDLDLYVVSGGVECEPESDLLRDRLYLNDGRGNLTRSAIDDLPDVRDSGSVAAAADFDRDGDLDIFVGGRVIPGRYPLSPTSRLLQNDDGRFRDVTEQLAPRLQQTGLVTGAIWSDADGDGWVDLLVAHEWGPVKFFRNRDGRLVDQTQEAGLSDWTGWWNGIASGDLNGDGSVDYVVTNFGLNTKYHASKDRPALLFYGDFAGHGERKLVEAEYENDILYPVRGKSCSTRAIPTLARQFTTFKEFATASLQDLYTSQCLEHAYRLEANTLESGVFWNDGSGRFRFQPLPRLAQFSPGFGVAVTDVNADGKLDVYLVQNFYSPQPETGRMDGGLSLLLTGTGQTGAPLQPVWPKQSGLLVPGDAKALATTDLNGDGWLDFVVTLNDGDLLAFENQGGDPRRLLTIRLEGKRGNPSAVGARVTLHLADGSQQIAEVQAGSGYLSQSTSRLTFGLGSAGIVQEIHVNWPDGTRSSHSPDVESRDIVISQP